MKLDTYIQAYLSENKAAKAWYEICKKAGKQAVVDHITFRCINVEERAKEFLSLGYTFSEKVDYPDQGWWANVYRMGEDLPAIFIDQDYEEFKNGIIAPWVKLFGDKVLHHIAVRVEDIEKAKQDMEQAGIRFPADIVGGKGSPLRQIFTAAEVKQGKPYSVLEITERGIDPRTGKMYTGFINLQADQLMKDSLKT